MQQQELAQMRQRDANLTALAAIGPRKKRKLDAPGLLTIGGEVSVHPQQGNHSCRASQTAGAAPAAAGREVCHLEMHISTGAQLGLPQLKWHLLVVVFSGVNFQQVIKECF